MDAVWEVLFCDRRVCLCRAEERAATERNRLIQEQVDTYERRIAENERWVMPEYIDGVRSGVDVTIRRVEVV